MPNPETTDQLEALAVRCEQAAGPDYEIDAAIADALGRGSWYAIGNPAWKFTASVDAALTLVPEGLCLTVQERNVNDDHNWRYFASLWNPTTDVETRGKARHGKLALAICATALRASKDTSHGR